MKATLVGILIYLGLAILFFGLLQVIALWTGGLLYCFFSQSRFSLFGVKK